MLQYQKEYLTIRNSSKQQQTSGQQEEGLANGSRQEHNNGHSAYSR